MHALKIEASLLTIYDPAADKPVREVTMVQCVHCGAHRPPSPQLGFCMNCNGFTCGPRCEQCVPLEQFLENVERGLPENHRPAKVFVPSTFGWKK